MLNKPNCSKPIESENQNVELDQLIETKATKIFFNPKKRIIYGLSLIFLSSPFLVLGLVQLFKDFWDNTFTQAFTSLFLILLGSPVIIGIALIRNKSLSNNGFFPPLFLIFFGFFLLLSSPLIYVDGNSKLSLTLFGLAFGCACIYLGFKRKRQNG